MSKDSLRLRNAILAGIFAAMGIVLKTFAITTLEFRFSFYDIPLFIGGMLLGPGFGLIIGFVTDWIYVLIHPFAFTFNLMTVSTMIWGFIAGLAFYGKLANLNMVKLTVVIVVTSFIAFLLNSVQLYWWFGSGMFAQLPLRFITMVIKWPIQVFAIKLIYDRVLIHTQLVPFMK